MKPYIDHYYDWPNLQRADHEILNTLYKTVKVIDEATGKMAVDFDPQQFRQEGDFIISNDENRLHLCLSTDEVIRVPEGVKSIAYCAFYEDFCPNARHIVLSSTVDGISPYAIVGSTVEELTVNNKYIYISEDAFIRCKSLRMIHHIPGGATVHTKPDRRMGVRPDKYEAIELPESKACDDTIDDVDLPF